MLEFILREFLGIPVWLWIVGWLGIAVILNQISQMVAGYWIFLPLIILYLLIYCLIWFRNFWWAVVFNQPMERITIGNVLWWKTDQNGD